MLVFLFACMCVCADVIELHAVCVLVLTYTHTRVRLPCLKARLCVLSLCVSVHAMRVLWCNGDAASMCICCKCVCVCVRRPFRRTLMNVCV